MESWVEEHKRRFLDALSERVGERFYLEGRRESRWARSARGTIAVLASKQHPQRPPWWFGLNKDEFRRRGALGVVFLCQTDEGVIDFGLSASSIEPMLSRVSREARTGDHKLHIVREAGRYVLLPDLDLTPFKGDTGWLETGPASTSRRTQLAGAAVTSAASPTDHEVAFFAKVRAAMIEPLDPIGLPDGEFLLVRATVATSVPGSPALRRIVARGGPPGLPADLAERHDGYRRRTEM